MRQSGMWKGGGRSSGSMGIVGYYLGYGRPCGV